VISVLTARYLKTESGYMGQVLEWPEVVTEGRDLEDCRASLKDALEQMILAYREMGKEPPAEQVLFEPLAVESI
jgi:predicted RNase H-like HicB family nuclease